MGKNAKLVKINPTDKTVHMGQIYKSVKMSQMPNWSKRVKMITRSK